MLFRFLILLFLVSCQQVAKPPPNTLRMSFLQDPATIDPRKSSDYTSSTLICLLFEGLTRCTGGVDVELAIAENVELSQDRKVYTFHLRKTLWSNGQSVTAFDFERSWKTLLTPGFPSPCAYLLFPIKNAENYAKGLCHDIGVQAMDDYTLKVELEKPTPYFLSLTAFPLYFPSPSQSNVFNGPFIIDKMDIGSQILLKRNPIFWKTVPLENIHISIVRDELTAIHMFEKGELDLLGGPLTPLTLDILPKKLPYHLIPMAASTFCTLNTKALNKEIRMDLWSAIRNHPEMNQEIKSWGQIPTTHILPPSLRENFQKEEHFNPVISLVKNKNVNVLMNRCTSTPLTLYYKNHPLEKKMAQTLQKAWKDSGFDVRIEQVESKSLMKKLYQKNYQLSLASWIAQYHDPMNILERFKDETNAKNYPGWSSPELNHLLADHECDKGEQLLEEEAILIPLYHWNSPLLLHPRVRGFSSTSTGGLILERISLQ
ncbi:MAG TPA: peptide ABC transporter substrate-binding protein [Chlamydiales bacterium]|nr:peptide ABC transporter substrate-binding protein [Chlamydiales bacterium]